MLVNWLKKLTYKIYLSPEEVIGRIKSKTVFSNKLNGHNDLFEGGFKSDTFEIHFMSDSGVWNVNSFCPRFCGKVTEKDGYTELTIRTRPMMCIYPFLLMPFIFLIAGVFGLVCRPDTLIAGFVFIVISLGFSIFILAAFNSMQQSFKSILEEYIFDDALIK